MVLTSERLNRAAELGREGVEAWEGRLLEVGGQADHLRSWFSLPPKDALADFMNTLKTVTSRRQPPALCYLVRPRTAGGSPPLR